MVILGFILGLVAGVILMCILAIKASAEVDEYNKELIDNIEEDKTSFTYDCLNDPDDDNDEHISKIY